MHPKYNNIFNCYVFIDELQNKLQDSNYHYGFLKGITHKINNKKKLNANKI